jgi:hypothetical protein
VSEAIQLNGQLHNVDRVLTVLMRPVGETMGLNVLAAHVAELMYPEPYEAVPLTDEERRFHLRYLHSLTPESLRLVAQTHGWITRRVTDAPRFKWYADMALEACEALTKRHSQASSSTRRKQLCGIPASAPFDSALWASLIAGQPGATSEWCPERTK